MNATQSRAITLTRDAYQLAYALNRIPSLECLPCRAAFKAARAIISAEFGQDVAELVDARVLCCGEYDRANLIQWVEEATREIEMIRNETWWLLRGRPGGATPPRLPSTRYAAWNPIGQPIGSER